MPQLSLYLDASTMETLRADASREGKTLSNFVRTVLQDRTANGQWPQGFFDLYGALADDPTFVEPPELPWDANRPIPSFD